MTTDKPKPAAPNYKLVRLTERWMVQYWITALGCSENELRTAVATVGNAVHAVRECLAAERQRISASA